MATEPVILENTRWVQSVAFDLPNGIHVIYTIRNVYGKDRFDPPEEWQEFEITAFGRTVKYNNKAAADSFLEKLNE